MEAVSPSIGLVEAQRLLTLFAQGISGRYFHLEPLAELAGTFRSATPFGDGETLFLPDTVEEFAEPRHNLGFYKVTVMHQLGFFELETFAVQLEEAQRRVPALAGRQAERRRARPGELEMFFACFEEEGLVRRLFGVLEDHRIDCGLRRAYPGLRADLDRASALALAKRGELGRIEGAAGLLEALVRTTLGADPELLRAADVTGHIGGVIDAAARVGQEPADVYTTAEQALRCLALLRAAGLEAGLELSGLGEVEGEVDTVEFRGDAPLDLAQLRLRAEATQRVLDTLGEAGVAAPETLERMAAEMGGGVSAEELPGALERRNESDRAVLRRAFGEKSRGERSFLYDEWDYTRPGYLRGWCRLYEERLRGESGSAFLESVHHRHGALIARVRRQFQHIVPESTERVRKVADGDEIDLDRAVEARSDVRAGLAPDERVYMRRDRARREVAAAFLVDLSASMSESVPDPLGEPEKPRVPVDDDPYLWGVHPSPDPSAQKRRTVLDIQKEALALMVQALEALGDEYAIYGFSGEGRSKVEFYVAKDFRDRLGLPVWNAIAALRPRGYTRMGTAIRHTISKLARQDASRKVMLLISDGFPQDTDYGPDRDDRAYGIHDTAQALREAERARIQTFCVTIDRAGHDYLRQMCPEGRYLVIDEVESLPAELGKVYRQLTRS